MDKLSSPKLQEAVVNVPRHHFVPVFFEQRQPGSAEWVTVSRDDEATRPRWWEQVYSMASW